VVGTSAGGVEALQEMVADLPDDLAASLFVVMHMPPGGRSFLPEILSRRCSWLITHARANELIEPHRIYVAPPDYHLMIERNHRIALWHGPKENNFRPAINPLFRSAADVYGNRVVGIVLTGSLYDGVAGLSWIKRHGGATVIQDPREARFSDMPQNALKYVEVDYVMPVSGIAGLLVELANGLETAERSGENNGITAAD
jgi:two-component system chemotaxis response regulator CheB